MWPEDMVLAIIPTPHRYSMFQSVYKRRGYSSVSVENVQILTDQEQISECHMFR